MIHIEKSGFRHGEYVGYADGVWLIRKIPNGWRARHRDDPSRNSIQAATLRKLDLMLSKVAEGLKKNPATETRKLALYIENNGDLYRRQTIPIIKNLQRKIAKGVYDPAKALILWKHLADSGAQMYAKEFGGPGDKWSQMFSVADRKAVAKELAERYEEHVKEKPMTASRAKRQAVRVKTYFSNPRRRGGISPGEAAQILSGLENDRADFHSLRSSEVQYLLDAAREIGYRQPKGASGSKARYFYAFLQTRRASRVHERTGRAIQRVKRNPRRTVPPIKKQRTVTNDDLWSAIRGLGMFGKSVDQLIALYNEHKDSDLFASKVIAEAAKQVAITKGAKIVRK